MDETVFVVPHPTMAFLPLFVAHDKGFFEKEGLKSRLDLGSSLSRDEMIEELKSGEPVFYVLVFLAIRGFFEGAEPKLLCNIFNQVVHRVVAKREIATVEHLKGKTLMVNAFVGTSIIEAKFVLRQHGVNPETDLKIVEAGPGLEIAQLEALKKGEVDAIASSAPYWYLAEKAGFHTLGYAGDSYPDWIAVALLTGASLIRKHPETVEKAVRALVKAEKYMYDNREETVQVILDNMSYADYETASALYDRLREAWTPQLNPESVRNFVELYCKENGLSVVQVEDLLDLRFLEEALK